MKAQLMTLTLLALIVGAVAASIWGALGWMAKGPTQRLKARPNIYTAHPESDSPVSREIL